MKRKVLIAVLGIATIATAATLATLSIKKRRQKAHPKEEYTGQAKQDLGT